jgi:hypothetical protein
LYEWTLKQLYSIDSFTNYRGSNSYRKYRSYTAHFARQFTDQLLCAEGMREAPDSPAVESADAPAVVVEDVPIQFFSALVTKEACS